MKRQKKKGGLKANKGKKKWYGVLLWGFVGIEVLYIMCWDIVKLRYNYL